MSATVVSDVSAISGEYPLVTPEAIEGLRHAYLPVSKAYRVGVQTAEGEWASVNRIPSFANRSIWTVGILDSAL